VIAIEGESYQREVIRSLKRHVDDKEDSVNQVIFTTHSTIMIDGVDHTEVVLFRKVNDPTRSFRTTVTQLPDNFYSKYGLEEYKYYQFHRYKNSDFFYSKLVVVVESKNDGQAVQELMRKDGYELDDLGVSILSLDGVNNLAYAVSLIKELGLPSLVIVDKDFFIPYEKDKLDESRDQHGFPKYRKEYKGERLGQIKTLIPSEKDRTQILPLLIGNHTKALDLLAEHGIVCMKWGLEVDLVNSSRGRELFARELRLQPDKSDSKTLLVKYKDKIKGIEVISPVIRDLPKKSYPNSFSKICETLGSMLSKL
jgi:hypothetical protein